MKRGSIQGKNTNSDKGNQIKDKGKGIEDPALQEKKLLEIINNLQEIIKRLENKRYITIEDLKQQLSYCSCQKQNQTTQGGNFPHFLMVTEVLLDLFQLMNKEATIFRLYIRVYVYESKCRDTLLGWLPLLLL